MKKAYVFLADGFEEIEGLTVVDVLRRGGAEVEMVSVMDRKEITGAHGIKVEADRMIEEAGEADLYVLPGGMPGTLHLKEHAGLCRLLNQAEKKEKHIAAICAAPRTAKPSSTSPRAARASASTVPAWSPSTRVTARR